MSMLIWIRRIEENIDKERERRKGDAADDYKNSTIRIQTDLRHLIEKNVTNFVLLI